jgi:hypothetical protein
MWEYAGCRRTEQKRSPAEALSTELTELDGLDGRDGLDSSAGTELYGGAAERTG